MAPATGPRGALPPGPAVPGDNARVRVQGEQPGHDLRLEVTAAREPAGQGRGGRPRIARPDGIPLRPDRALLGHVSALRRHTGDVVAGVHPSILGLRGKGAVTRIGTSGAQVTLT